MTLVLLGWTLDWSLEPTGSEADTARDLSGGELGSRVVGFERHGDQRWAEHETPEL